MDTKYCRGCYNDYYNGHNRVGIKGCWHLPKAKVVWRVPIGQWEPPPYDLKCIRVASCWSGDATIAIRYKPKSAFTKEGYWK